MTQLDLTQIEFEILEMLLSGNDVILNALRQQLASAIVFGNK
jgi:DNA-binding response OmpR family regulator